ncbi:MAG TPA: FAD-dependent oxidoreductase [Thermoanaerobaculia bacterium]
MFFALDATVQQASTSLWNATTPVSPATQRLSGDVHVDVAIIGAGITGLTAAVLLEERGRSVAVLEKEGVAAGETGNTTAHITEAVDARYHYLRRTFGKDEARQIAQASHAAMEKIAELVGKYSIDCRFRRVPGYLYTEKRKYIAQVKNEVSAAQEAGLDVRWQGEVPLPFPTRGAAVFANQAQFHPGLYAAALAARVPRIFTNTPVTSITPGEPCVVETPHGKVFARAVLQATNVPIAGFQTVHTKAAAWRTYAIAFLMEGDPADHPEGLFWDTADPYHYTRWQETGEGTYMIVGGEDHKVGDEEDTEACFERLRQYVREQFGVHPERYRWSGQIIEPHDGLPFIGGHGPLYISTGYSGQGMTMGTLGAMLCTDLITGVENPLAALVDPMRVHVRGSVREFLAQNLGFAAQVVSDRLTAHDVESTDPFDVKSGEGKIVAVDGRKVACYRDEAGTLHAVSPVCTHMRCDVAFNAAERTWDCPCHGSRFTPDGEVLNGPAKLPLEKIDL